MCCRWRLATITVAKKQDTPILSQGYPGSLTDLLLAPFYIPVMDHMPTMQDNVSQAPVAKPSGSASDTRSHMLLPILALTILFLVLVARAAADPALWVSASVTLTQSEMAGDRPLFD